MQGAFRCRTTPRPSRYGSIAVDGLNIAYREAGDPAQSQARAAARLSGVVAPVPRPHSRVGRPLSRDRAGLSGLRAERHARSSDVPVHVRRIAERRSSAFSRIKGFNSLRPVRAGLRRPGWVPTRRASAGRARVAHHPELERVRGRLHGGVGRASERAVEEPLAGDRGSRCSDSSRATRSRRSICMARSVRSW